MEACPNLFTIPKSENLPFEPQDLPSEPRNKNSCSQPPLSPENQIFSELNDILKFASIPCNEDNSLFCPKRLKTNPVIYDKSFRDLEYSLSTSEDSNSEPEYFQLYD